MALPQHHLGIAELLRRIAAQLAERVPDHHLIQGDPHVQARVAAQVLVGQEQDPLSLIEGPLKHCLGVGLGAYGAAVTAAQGLDTRDRVHVGDEDDAARSQDLFQVSPGVVNVLHRGHVSHGTASGDIG